MNTKHEHCFYYSPCFFSFVFWEELRTKAQHNTTIYAVCIVPIRLCSRTQSIKLFVPEGLTVNCILTGVAVSLGALLFSAMLVLFPLCFLFFLIKLWWRDEAEKSAQTLLQEHTNRNGILILLWTASLFPQHGQILCLSSWCILCFPVVSRHECFTLGCCRLTVRDLWSKHTTI